MPSARDDWIMAATPEFGSVRSRTVHEPAEVDTTCPTTPLGPRAVSPASTPLLEPMSRVMVWFQASVECPMTRPETPSML